MTEQMYTPADLMEILSLSRSATYSLLREGEIQHYKVGRNLRVSESDIASYLESRRMPTRFEDQDLEKRYPSNWWASSLGGQDEEEGDDERSSYYWDDLEEKEQ